MLYHSGDLSTTKHVHDNLSLHNNSSGSDTHLMLSESAPVTEPVASSELEGAQKLTEFVSDVTSEVVETPSSWDITRADALNPEADLGSFLSRPVQLARINWTNSSYLQTSLNVWSDFLTHPTIVKKLQNYSWLSGSLHVKLQINGGPFYFGKALASYTPYGFSAPTNISNNYVRNNSLARMSQRDHVILDPTECKGGTIVCPFVYPKPYLSLDTADLASLDGVGRVDIMSFEALQNTSADTSTPINISVYAWMEDVRLSGPTYLRSESKMVSGKKDEYGQGVISKPATALAKAAGHFKKIPGIGPYATATQIAASGIADVAKLFGYSRPVSLEPIHKYRVAPMGNMANSSIDEAVDKLTFDPKQELTINSDVIGISRDDELQIKDIAMKESFYNMFSWADYSGAGDKIFSCNVSPIIYSTQVTDDPDFSQVAIQTTPLMHAAVPFKYWRGGITYRFEVMCSAFHRGRLKLQYVPNQETSLTEGDMSAVYTRIMDISESKVFEVTINWNQNISYKEISPITEHNPPQICGPRMRSSPAAVGVTTPYLKNYCNGQFAIYVQNELTSPDASDTKEIWVNCYVKGSDDIEFAEPVEGFGKLSNFPNILISESQMISESGGGNSSWAVQQDSPNGTFACQLEPIGKSARLDELNLVHFGETFCTFRDMLKRYNYNRTYGDITTGKTSGTYQLELTLPNFPVYRGADESGGLDSVTTSAGAKSYTYSRTTLLNWLTPAFVARRGGLRWKYLVAHKDNSKLKELTVERMTSNTFAIIGPIRRNLNSGAVALDYLRASPKASQGMYATHTDVLPTVEVELPYYSNYRFSTTNDISAFSMAEHHILRLNADVSGTEDIATVSAFVATGEDFNLSWYVCSPEVFYQPDAAS
ncbi:structural polyprotein [Chaetoceros tenuissimus RNA virus 01]|uniref:Structural polyprotein n=1 Tax=Chaetoceros tenuissimus RNA virus 01 TaxID=497136 RepID=B2DDF0_9VIRU|nr:structural polyprotein [Chaetoceros tenuissimus RNA virus 01]BAG30952.1 structural polyprotein [Chaetoceros tenuissimus RNA virus 01]